MAAGDNAAAADADEEAMLLRSALPLVFAGALDADAGVGATDCTTLEAAEAAACTGTDASDARPDNAPEVHDENDEIAPPALPATAPAAEEAAAATARVREGVGAAGAAATADGATSLALDDGELPAGPAGVAVVDGVSPAAAGGATTSFGDVSGVALVDCAVAAAAACSLPVGENVDDATAA